MLSGQTSHRGTTFRGGLLHVSSHLMKHTCILPVCSLFFQQLILPSVCGYQQLEEEGSEFIYPSLLE